MKFGLALICLLAISGEVKQEKKEQGKKEQGKPVSLGKMPTVELKPGTPAEAVISVIVESGFHIQANPVSNPRLIPTTLEMGEVGGIKPGIPSYPRGKAYRLQGTAEDIAIYDGKFEIKLPLFAQASAKAGKTLLQGKLKFQPCNDKICFFPSDIPVTIPVKVTK